MLPQTVQFKQSSSLRVIKIQEIYIENIYSNFLIKPWKNMKCRLLLNTIFIHIYIYIVHSKVQQLQS